jgi:hypothetical protein
MTDPSGSIVIECALVRPVGGVAKIERLVDGAHVTWHHRGAVDPVAGKWVAERNDAAHPREVVVAAGDEKRLLVECADYWVTNGSGGHFDWAQARRSPEQLGGAISDAWRRRRRYRAVGQAITGRGYRTGPMEAREVLVRCSRTS